MFDDQKPQDDLPADDDQPREDAAESAGSGEPDGDEPSAASPEDETAEPQGEGAPESEESAPDRDAEAQESGVGDGTEAPVAQEKAPTPGTFDGLDSGLAWYGAEPFEPPLPTGYLPPPEAVAGAEPAPTADRSQRIKDRLASRRAETEAEKTWIQKVPIPVWLCMPATVFIIIWIVVFAKPWAQIPEPGEDMKIDSALLTASGVDDVIGRMIALRIKSWDPEPAWQILADDVLGLKSRKARARLVFDAPEPKNFTVRCEVCIVDTLDDYNVWLRIHESRAVGLVGSDIKGSDSGAACYKPDATGTKTLQVLQTTPVKPGYWYSLAIRVNDGKCTYSVNGKDLSESPQAPTKIDSISVVSANVRLYIRNWSVAPVE